MHSKTYTLQKDWYWLADRSGVVPAGDSRASAVMFAREHQIIAYSEAVRLRITQPDSPKKAPMPKPSPTKRTKRREPAANK